MQEVHDVAEPVQVAHDEEHATHVEPLTNVLDGQEDTQLDWYWYWPFGHDEQVFPLTKVPLGQETTHDEP